MAEVEPRAQLPASQNPRFMHLRANGKDEMDAAMADLNDRIVQLNAEILFVSHAVSINQTDNPLIYSTVVVYRTPVVP